MNEKNFAQQQQASNEMMNANNNADRLLRLGRKMCEPHGKPLRDDAKNHEDGSVCEE